MKITKNYHNKFNFLDVKNMSSSEEYQFYKNENHTHIIPFYEDENDPMKNKDNWYGPVDYFLAINEVKL